MIDTDKYEGHIENIGRWQMFANALPRWAEDADRKLVQDAPLLLEEVMRLRDELHATHTWVEYTLLRLKNGAITKDELIESLWDMCNDPAHKAIVGVTE